MRLHGNGKNVIEYALMDDGSTVTLIDYELANTIGAKGQVEPIEIICVGDVGIVNSFSRKIDLKISAID